MRRIARIESGPYSGSGGRVVCCDSDHDSLPELLFHTGTIQPSDPLRIEVWELCRRLGNQFQLVYADTGEYPEPVGITTGNSIPFASGDIDGDGLTDIVCITVEPDSINPDIAYDDVITIESPDSFSYPCSLSWYYRYGNNFVIPNPTNYLPDLDKDGHREIFSATPSMGACFWENVRNNQNELVWRDTTHPGYRLTYGDFDLDGRMNFASASLGSYGTMSVWECTGDDQYNVVYQDTVWQPNGADLFTTNDIDGDGKPEFYVAYENVPRGKMYLYMWEADQVGVDEYHRTLVDSVRFSGTDWGRISECGDIDGDSVDECIWTTPDRINVYKAFGDNDLREVWHWNNDHGGFRSLVSTVYDVNGDGYNELITAGNAKISIFEVDAVDLLSPNGGSCGVGDTVSIRWVTNTPPRCDSLSLFVRRDSLWRLDTIATGLPATDTLYRWVVPDDSLDTCRIVVMAYGPGWQYDISDSVIYILPAGVAEGPRRMPVQWALSVSPNPARGRVTIRYDVPCPAQVRVCLFDASGRAAKTLAQGTAAPGRYVVQVVATGDIPEGVYYVTMQESGRERQTWTRKLVIQH